jgi:L-ascorbate metabolism protein UlaG (beta-lactamase superfamily)
MIITYHGAEFFKVSFGDTTLAFNPISRTSKLKQTKFGADIALISLEHPDMNGVEQVAYGEKEPFVVRGPGEYEVRDVLIKGYPTVSRYGGTELINTVYLVTLERMLLLYLGALATKELPAELKEALDQIDVLFVPVGGEGVLEPADAHEFAVSIEPKIVVPMHYGGVGRKDALQLFMKEEASEGTNHAPVDKLTLKAKDLEDKENDVVVFSV